MDQTVPLIYILSVFGEKQLKGFFDNCKFNHENSNDEYDCYVCDEIENNRFVLLQQLQKNGLLNFEKVRGRKYKVKFKKGIFLGVRNFYTKKTYSYLPINLTELINCMTDIMLIMYVNLPDIENNIRATLDSIVSYNDIITFESDEIQSLRNYYAFIFSVLLNNVDYFHSILSIVFGYSKQLLHSDKYVVGKSKTVLNDIYTKMKLLIDVISQQLSLESLEGFEKSTLELLSYIHIELKKVMVYRLSNGVFFDSYNLVIGSDGKIVKYEDWIKGKSPSDMKMAFYTIGSIIKILSNREKLKMKIDNIDFIHEYRGRFVGESRTGRKKEGINSNKDQSFINKLRKEIAGKNLLDQSMGKIINPIVVDLTIG